MATIQLAVSENSMNQVLRNLIDNFHLTKSGSSSGYFRASYNVGIGLTGGSIDFKNNPDEIVLKEIDVNWNPLNVTLEVDIPKVCVGGFCIIPNPFGGCLLRAPRICLFSSNPDIRIPLNLDGLITSEISGGFNVDIRYRDDPVNNTMNPYQAYAANNLDKWQVYLSSRWLNLDIIDISDTVGNLLDRIVDNFINGVFGGLPGWAKDILSWLLNGINDIIRGILDIGDDIKEWLSDLLGVSFGLFDFIVQQVGNYIANNHPLYEISNPYPIVPGADPVLLPISAIRTDVTNDEFVINVSI
ncbi:hypothetical protein [Perlabentimonas gracilis]|uniref:hypothetical protein n=1 Tax=Perlabentimonas gracilis TaxID=2715279 RepID=UPI00140BEFCD|nr:hypothetical protein [Perlabentimonas gracilis]NHB69803.1 hypothetical protein [Perlabentimonas gracilis]